MDGFFRDIFHITGLKKEHGNVENENLKGFFTARKNEIWKLRIKIFKYYIIIPYFLSFLKKKTFSV